MIIHQLQINVNKFFEKNIKHIEIVGDIFKYRSVLAEKLETDL